MESKQKWGLLPSRAPQATSRKTSIQMAIHNLERKLEKMDQEFEAGIELEKLEMEKMHVLRQAKMEKECRKIPCRDSRSPTPTYVTLQTDHFGEKQGVVPG